MSGAIIEDEDLLRAAAYALSIVRRTGPLAMADDLDAVYQAALTTLTAYVQALESVDVRRACNRRPW